MKTINAQKTPRNPYVTAKIALLSGGYLLLLGMFILVIICAVVFSDPFWWIILSVVVGFCWLVATVGGLIAITDWLDEQAKRWRPGPED